MSERFSYATLKQAADQAFKKGAFQEAGDLYSKILVECKLPAAVKNTILGNRCLASQRAGRHQDRTGQYRRPCRLLSCSLLVLANSALVSSFMQMSPRVKSNNDAILTYRELAESNRRCAGGLEISTQDYNSLVSFWNFAYHCQDAS